MLTRSTDPDRDKPVIEETNPNQDKIDQLQEDIHNYPDNSPEATSIATQIELLRHKENFIKK
jgi:hypothetical protein